MSQNDTLLSLPDCPHPVLVSANHNGLSDILSVIKYDQLYVLTDHQVAASVVPRLLEEVPACRRADVFQVLPGEQSKSLEMAENLWQHWFDQKASRSSLLLNVGGGMITDLGGFAASIYKRGIRFIHLPTSLLCMVDAALGGKTGVNHLHFKNSLGTTRMPEAVFVNTSWLNSLPIPELNSGWAEVVKTTLLSDISLWKQCIKVQPDLHLNWVFWIRHCLETKWRYVQPDPEDHGIRKALNLGHSIAHALEAAAMIRTYPLLHGHAVAMGLWGEMWIASQLNLLSKEWQKEINDYIISIFAAYWWKDWEIDPLIDAILQDKKNENGNIRLTLLKHPGCPLLDVPVPETLIRDALVEIKQAV